MLVGAVDFQKAIRVDGDDFFGAHWQEDVFYLLPATKVVIKEDPVLAFLLSIFYSEELQVIHGKLNFTTQFNFSDIDHLSDFRKMHPEASVTPLPELRRSGNRSTEPCPGPLRNQLVQHCEFQFLD